MFSKRLGQLPLAVKFQPFEQAVLRFLKSHGLVDQPILVGVSGGVDSMSLLFCLWRLSAAAGLKVHAVSIHHGKSTLAQTKFRNRARAAVEKFCEERKIPFYTNSVLPFGLSSENDLREFRLREMAKVQQAAGIGTLFLAHHQDDLVETQLLRLIRGTGLQGLLGFAGFAGGVARPFVGQFRKKEITQYAKKMKVPVVADPSNEKAVPLRNWLRQKWLAPLEKREAGLYSSLSRSLANLAEASSTVTPPALGLIQNGKIDHALFMTLTRDQKEALLANYMRGQNIRGYGVSHIREILKRLDSAKSELNFRLLRRDWCVNAEHIFCDPGT